LSTALYHRTVDEAHFLAPFTTFNRLLQEALEKELKQKLKDTERLNVSHLIRKAKKQNPGLDEVPEKTMRRWYEAMRK
jgi:hypothetical protein